MCFFWCCTSLKGGARGHQMGPQPGSALPNGTTLWMVGWRRRGGCRKQSTYGGWMQIEHANNGAQTRPRERSAARKHSHMHRESHMHGEKRPQNIWNQASRTTPPPGGPIASLSALLPEAARAASPSTPTDTHFITPVTDGLF